MTPITVVTALAMFAATFCASGAGSATGPGSGSNAVLVELKGVQITQADLELKRPSAMSQARTNFCEAERKHYPTTVPSGSTFGGVRNSRRALRFILSVWVTPFG
jgi:hypothetical protein